LIDGCDLVFLAKSKDGDYHQEMNSFVFLEWFENQLMPALKNPSFNASYHNVKTEDKVCPNFSQRFTCFQIFAIFCLCSLVYFLQDFGYILFMLFGLLAPIFWPYSIYALWFTCSLILAIFCLCSLVYLAPRH
jgi:hypothetical protein